MMRNPFKHHYTQEQVDEAAEELGWGTKIQRRVPRSGGEPLHFQIRLPNDARCIEVSDLAAAAQNAPAWLEGRSEALRDVGRQAGAVLVGAVCDQSDPTDVLLTITVVFSEQVDGPAMQVSEPAPGEKVIQRVERISDTETRVKRTSAVTLEPGADPIGLLVDEYLIQTGFGGLAIAFSTTHNGMLGGRGQGFFRAILKTLWLGDAEAPN